MRKALLRNVAASGWRMRESASVFLSSGTSRAHLAKKFLLRPRLDSYAFILFRIILNDRG